jgi:hypothetical protein
MAILTETELKKIDRAAVSGLSGTVNSLAYKIHELEKHIHNSELCYGKAAGNELLQDSLVPFVVTAAADATNWGVETVVSAGGVVAGVYYDLDELTVTACGAGAGAGDIFEVQFRYGVGASDTVLGSTYYVVQTTTGKSGYVGLKSPRIPVASKLSAWCKCSNPDSTLSFLLSLHTYSG